MSFAALLPIASLLARAGGGEVFGGGSGGEPGGGFGGFGGGVFYGGGGAAGALIVMVLFFFMFSGMRRGTWRRGPWGGGPWGGGPWGGGPSNRPGGSGPPMGGQGNPGPPPGPATPTGTLPGGASPAGDQGEASSGNGWPGAGGAPAGGPAGWEAGGGPAGGGWEAGGGPPGRRPASGPQVGESHGAGERLYGAGAPVPGEEPDWLHDDRPAAASIPGELFPEAHAQAMQAASPLDVGLAAIKAHDPGFDLEQFTQQVQRVFFVVQEAWSERKPEMSRQVMADDLWQQHRAQIQGYIDAHRRNMLDYLAVSNIWPVAAHSDQHFDTITMRIMAACADYDVDERTGKVVRGSRDVTQWQEDWTFQRSSRATTQASGGTLGSKCPNCGAPLDVDLAGACRYCKATIMSGEYDWVLARISQVG